MKHADMKSDVYEIVPLSAADSEQLRREGGRRYVADAEPGFPCRRCLLDAKIGEEVILVSHDPFESESPYRSASPIFLHAQECHPVDCDSVPDQMTCRQLSVRSFDVDEMMIDAMVVDGADLDELIRQLLTNDASDKLHIHNAQRGCYAAEVKRIDLGDGR